MAKKRIAKEIEEFKKDPFYNKKYGIEIINDNDLFHLSGWITGLENTPYENGTFFFNVHFPTDYPFAPIKINMTTRIFHISINANGTLCCCNWPELVKYEGWNPSYTLLKIVKLIRERLNNYPRDCVLSGFENSNLYNTNKELYFKKARNWTIKYAMFEEDKSIWDVYEKGKLIGSGKFGDVYYAVDKVNEKPVAIKIVKIGNDEETRKLVKNEIETMKTIKSNVLIETKMDELNTYFVMNLYDDNLENILNKRKSGFSYNEIKNIFKELNPTFEELHKNKIMHGDLKLNNILIKYKDEKKIDFNVSLSDFGLSKTITSSKTLDNKGNYITTSPEIINAEEGEHVNFMKSDLWGIGIIIYQLYFNEYPFNLKEKTTYGILNKLYLGKKLKVPNESVLADLLGKILVVDPEKRITWEEYFNHSFFR